MKIFLSYASERGADAKMLFDFLKPFGFDVWYDKESLIGGQDWDRERLEAQKAADLTLLILSPETNTKTGVIQREIREAQRQLEDQPPGSIYLVTLRTDSITLPAELSRWQYIDLFGTDWRVRLSRSIELKCRQLALSVPPELAAILQHSNIAQQTTRTIEFENASAKLAADFFTYNLEGDFWRYVNATIISEFYGDYFKYRSGFADYVPDDDPRKSEWSLRLEEFFRDGELLSLRLFHYEYESGAAHGNFGIGTKSFSGDCGSFSIHHVIEFTADTASMLRKYCELDVARQFVDHTVDFSTLREDTPTWETFNQFNFDREGLLFNFSPYSMLPYGYGPLEVRMPWKQIRPQLSRWCIDGPIGAQFGLASLT